MVQVLKDHWYIVVAGAAALLFIVLFIQKRVKQKKREKEQYAQRLKDQVLNEALKNNLGRRNAFREEKQAEPLEQAVNANLGSGAKGSLIVMKLTVIGEKKENYVVSPEEHVILGSASGMNDIILKGENIAQQHCDIFLYNNHVYVRNLNPAYGMVLQRKGSQTPVGENGIRILTGDWIFMGNYRIRIMFMDYIGNIISG